MIRRAGATPTGDAHLDATFQELVQGVFVTGVDQALALSTAERDAVTGWRPGAFIYNVTTGKHQGFDGSLWNDFY